MQSRSDNHSTRRSSSTKSIQYLLLHYYYAFLGRQQHFAGKHCPHSPRYSSTQYLDELGNEIHVRTTAGQSQTAESGQIVAVMEEQLRHAVPPVTDYRQTRGISVRTYKSQHNGEEESQDSPIQPGKTPKLPHCSPVALRKKPPV